MADLHKALGDISSIRREVARSTQFRGYGPATLAATSAFAVLAAVAQAVWVPDPVNHLQAYLAIWISTAVVSAILTGSQMYTRTRRMHSGLSDEMIRMAVEQFLPTVGAGVLLTLVLVRYVPTVTWMLPGLWQVIFSIGVFSSCRFLPRPMIAAGAWYLSTGLFCIAIGDSRALSPKTMGLAFGMGQLLVAGILLIATHEVGDETKSPASEGRFAYEGLDRVIHERARLSVLTSLITHPKGLLFNDLKQLCSLTDGNLSRHLRVLEAEKMVAIVKGHDRNRPQTICRITATGRKRYLEYLSTLEQVVKDAAKVATDEPAAGLLRGLTPSRA